MDQLVNIPLAQWHPFVIVLVVAYLVGFGATLMFSVLVEKFEPHYGSTAGKLAWVSILMAALWPVWALPLFFLAALRRLQSR